MPQTGTEHKRVVCVCVRGEREREDRGARAELGWSISGPLERAYVTALGLRLYLLSPRCLSHYRSSTLTFASTCTAREIQRPSLCPARIKVYTGEAHVGTVRERAESSGVRSSQGVLYFMLQHRFYVCDCNGHIS